MSYLDLFGHAAGAVAPIPTALAPVSTKMVPVSTEIAAQPADAPQLMLLPLPGVHS